MKIYKQIPPNLPFMILELLGIFCAIMAKSILGVIAFLGILLADLSVFLEDPKIMQGSGSISKRTMITFFCGISIFFIFGIWNVIRICNNIGVK